MITDENDDPCSAKYLANEILLRCLEDIGPYLRENVHQISKMTDKEQTDLNSQLVKQATRCFKLLGVHEDDIGKRYDPDEPWNSNMVDDERNPVDENGEPLEDDSSEDEALTEPVELVEDNPTPKTHPPGSMIEWTRGGSRKWPPTTEVDSTEPNPQK